MDVSRVGTVAAGLMERIADGEEDGVEIGVVGIVVELLYPPTAENDYNGSTGITVRCSDTRAWVQRGLFVEATHAT